ncbi:hypothetical protein RAD16_17480 [Bradyrhizobium sp. 18BD]
MEAPSQNDGDSQCRHVEREYSHKSAKDEPRDVRGRNTVHPDQDPRDQEAAKAEENAYADRTAGHLALVAKQNYGGTSII